MKRATLIGALLALISAPVLAQNAAPGGGPSVAFGQVTGVPIPLHSASGRFSSLNPLNRNDCREK